MDTCGCTCQCIECGHFRLVCLSHLLCLIFRTLVCMHSIKAKETSNRSSFGCDESNVEAIEESAREREREELMHGFANEYNAAVPLCIHTHRPFQSNLAFVAHIQNLTLRLCATDRFYHQSIETHQRGKHQSAYFLCN